MIQPQAKLTVMNFGHNNIWKWMPTVTMTGEDMVLRGHNEYNDSRQGKNVSKVTLTPLDKDGELRMKMSYNIDADHVRQVFGAG